MTHHVTCINRERSATGAPWILNEPQWAAFDTACATGCTHLIVMAGHPDFLKAGVVAFEDKLKLFMTDLQRIIETRITQTLPDNKVYHVHPATTIWVLNLPEGSYHLVSRHAQDDGALQHVRWTPLPGLAPQIPAGSFEAFARLFRHEAPLVQHHLRRLFWALI